MKDSLLFLDCENPEMVFFRVSVVINREDGCICRLLNSGIIGRGKLFDPGQLWSLYVLSTRRP